LLRRTLNSVNSFTCACLPLTKFVIFTEINSMRKSWCSQFSTWFLDSWNYSIVFRFQARGLKIWESLAQRHLLDQGSNNHLQRHFSKTVKTCKKHWEDAFLDISTQRNWSLKNTKSFSSFLRDWKMLMKSVKTFSNVTFRKVSSKLKSFLRSSWEFQNSALMSMMMVALSELLNS
jgi:hypothetical protein